MGENRPIGLGVISEIFSSRYLIEARLVGLECRRLILAVSVEMVVQSVPADLAAQADSSTLSPENDDFTVRNMTFFAARTSDPASTPAFGRTLASHGSAPRD
jgi:hypothetical protein